MYPQRKKQGIIFSLDGAIATTIVILMLVNTTYYFTTTSRESLSQTQLVKRGYDVITVFDMFGDLEDVINKFPEANATIPDDDVFDYSLNVSKYLPKGYDMLIEVYDVNETPCFGGGNCELTDDPDDAYVVLNDIENDGFYYVQAFFNSSGGTGTPPVSINVTNDTGSTAAQVPLTPYECTGAIGNCHGMYLTSKQPFHFRTSTVHGVGFSIHGAGGSTYQLRTVTLLDEKSYMATTNQSNHIKPTNQFVGSGERWFAAFNNSQFQGMHLVRFYIWLK